MHADEFHRPRPETLIAALLHLMTHYSRTGCPRLAVCILRHLQYLGLHPDADPVVREICAGLHGTWAEAAADRGPADQWH